MADDIAISVENVSKAYRIWKDPSARLTSPLCAGLARLFPADSVLRHRLRAKATGCWRDFYALRDVSLQVRKGECVGIIGRNGSGKSTLLQIIAGTLQPTTGSVRVNGRIAALLELGCGFNYEFTGRENVHLNAAVLGLTRAETDARFDEIAAFADIGDFLEQPVKTYSSGMVLRLAFAVQTAIDPDVLIIDEALSVGDEAFQRKCFARLDKLQQRGTTLLFVSHGAAQIVQLCSSAILLTQGRMEAAGLPTHVVNLYHQQLYGSTTVPDEKKPAPPSATVQAGGSIPWQVSVENPPAAEGSFLGEELVNSALVTYPPAGAIIHPPRLTTPDGRTVNHLSRGHSYCYTYEVEVTAPLRSVRFGCLVKTLTGLELGGMASHRNTERIPQIEAGQRYAVRFHFVCRLLPGTYFVNAGVIALSPAGEEYFAHRLVDALLFRVIYEPDLPVNALVDLLDHAEAAPIPTAPHG